MSKLHIFSVFLASAKRYCNLSILSVKCILLSFSLSQLQQQLLHWSMLCGDIMNFVLKYYRKLKEKEVTFYVNQCISKTLHTAGD